MNFDPESVKRYAGIDVEGIDGSEGWGCGLRAEDEGDVTMVTARDYDALLDLYKATQIPDGRSETLVMDNWKPTTP